MVFFVEQLSILFVFLFAAEDNYEFQIYKTSTV